MRNPLPHSSRFGGDMLKASDIRGFLIAVVICVALAAAVLWRVTAHRLARTSAPEATSTAQAPATGCTAAGWEAAAAANEASLETLAWAPFGPPETGWATYAPLIAREVGSPCPPDSSGFARSYARWQAGRKLTADGVFKPAEFDAARDALALRRPFVQATAKGICPAAPDPASLATARPEEAYGGKAVQLRPAALDAYRRMVAAARRSGVVGAAPNLRLVSGFRGPSEEAARCTDGGCNTLTRASCSAHRTGLALDLYLDAGPGAPPISTEDGARRRMSQTPEYRWLVANAQRFGFLPYAYEPWHWEWTGEPP